MDANAIVQYWILCFLACDVKFLVAKCILTKITAYKCVCVGGGGGGGEGVAQA